MKKIYLLIIAIILGLTFRGEAEQSSKPARDRSGNIFSCGRAKQRCKDVDGLTQYMKEGCLYKGDKQNVSECLLSFCTINCQTNYEEGFTCPNGNTEKDRKTMPKCQEFCRDLYYQDEALRKSIDVCIGGVKSRESAIEGRIELGLEKQRKRDIKAGRGEVRAWVSNVEKLCDNVQKATVQGTFWKGAIYIKDINKTDNNSIKEIEYLKEAVKEGMSTYTGSEYAKEKERVKNRVSSLTKTVQEIVTKRLVLINKASELGEANAALGDIVKPSNPPTAA